MRISDVDKIKADDVIASVAGTGSGLVKAVDVEARGENGPDAQELEGDTKSA
jgi:hypothetical protein